MPMHIRCNVIMTVCFDRTLLPGAPVCFLAAAFANNKKNTLILSVVRYFLITGNCVVAATNHDGSTSKDLFSGFFSPMSLLF